MTKRQVCRTGNLIVVFDEAIYSQNELIIRKKQDEHLSLTLVIPRNGKFDNKVYTNQFYA